MKLTIVAKCLNGSDIVGFVCANEEYTLGTIGYNQIVKGVECGKYELTNGEIISDGYNKKIDIYGESNYIAVSANNIREPATIRDRENRNKVILERIEKDGELIGYTICDYSNYGKIERIQLKDVDKFKYANGAIVESGGVKRIRALKSSFNVIETNANSNTNVEITVRSFGLVRGYKDEIYKGVEIEITAKNKKGIKECESLIVDNNKEFLNHVLKMYAPLLLGGVENLEKPGFKNSVKAVAVIEGYIKPLYSLKKNRHSVRGFVTYNHFIDILSKGDYSECLKFARSKDADNMTPLICRDIEASERYIIGIDMDTNKMKRIKTINCDYINRSISSMSEYANKIVELNKILNDRLLNLHEVEIL